jgi:hypothetical protein
VVLKLVWVAMTMPRAPQTMEMTAPTAKAKAVMKPCSVRKAITKNMTTTKMRQMAYSCFRNSTAP